MSACSTRHVSRAPPHGTRRTEWATRPGTTSATDVHVEYVGNRPRPAELTAVQRAFTDACVAAGYPAVAHHNVPRAHGDGPIPFNLIDGVRQSTALTYLAVARKRPNPTVRGGVLVERCC